MGYLDNMYTYYISDINLFLGVGRYPLKNKWILEKFKQEVKKITSLYDQTEIVMIHCSEKNINELSLGIDFLKSQKFKKITLIADQSSQPFSDQISGIDLIFINMFPLGTQSQSLRNLTWNVDKNKGLLLTGVLTRINRIVLLKKLYDLELLKHNICWTAPFIDQQHDSIKNFFIMMYVFLKDLFVYKQIQ